MMGIGGTGVVTVNQILGTAALLGGKRVWGLDQTGLSQKGGPVVSDLKIAARDFDASKIAAGGADLYLGFDLLVAADPRNLAAADPSRTVAVVSTSRVPTGEMVINTAVGFPRTDDLLAGIARATRGDGNVYLDAQAMAEALFGDPLPANVLLLGAAYQAGGVPIAAEAIEHAIRLNGAAVETNLAAFRWGRLAVADPAAVEAAMAANSPPSVARERAAGVGETARRLIDSAGAEGELRRLLEVRVPDLIDYQDAAYARQYVHFVAHVARVEQEKTPGRTAIAEAVARYLYKLMAYKDEYEVARLHLDTAARTQIAAGFDGDVKVSWNLHPPLLRALGLRHKIRLGPWFTPAMQTLKEMKRLRGTPLDPFGYAEVRRVERALIGEYRRMVTTALARLTPDNHAEVVALAELPDVIRGYERIKLDSVRRYRTQAGELMARLA
jgi:indolepyruvate ferredoxin oxidoreductase